MGPEWSGRSVTSKSIRADLPPHRSPVTARRSRLGWSRRPSWRSPQPALAHGFGQRYDLPVPFWLWAAAAGAAVALSFAIIGLFVKASPGVHGYWRLNLLGFRLGRLLAGRCVRLAVQLVSVGLLVLVVAASLLGDQSPTRNLAPTFIWVAWWVGVAYLSALVGNLWAVMNPWAAVFGWVDSLLGPRRAPARYPARLGVWPAVALSLAFAWIELIYTGRSIPAQLGHLVLAYSALTWTGMALFGRTAWLRHGDPFATAFGVLARFARRGSRDRPRGLPAVRGPLRRARRRMPRLRRMLRPRRARPARMEPPPLSIGAPGRRERVALHDRFVLLLLSTVAFDGFTATPAWGAWKARSTRR